MELLAVRDQAADGAHVRFSAEVLGVLDQLVVEHGQIVFGAETGSEAIKVAEQTGQGFGRGGAEEGDLVLHRFDRRTPGVERVLAAQRAGVFETFAGPSEGGVQAFLEHPPSGLLPGAPRQRPCPAGQFLGGLAELGFGGLRGRIGACDS